ncbi:hypothetical protein [Mesorhizobium sp. M1399]
MVKAIVALEIEITLDLINATICANCLLVELSDIAHPLVVIA